MVARYVTEEREREAQQYRLAREAKANRLAIQAIGSEPIDDEAAQLPI